MGHHRCNDSAGNSTIPQKGDEASVRSSATIHDSCTRIARPERPFGVRPAWSFSMHDLEGAGTTKNSSRSVSAERHSGTYSAGDRGHSRNQHRNRAGAPGARPSRDRTTGGYQRQGACAVTILVNSFRRIRSAENRVPHQTRWGTCGSLPSSRPGTLLGALCEYLLALQAITRQTAPTVILIVWNILR